MTEPKPKRKRRRPVVRTVRPEDITLVPYRTGDERRALCDPPKPRAHAGVMTTRFRILCGDASDLLAALDPESFDGVLCDPPYGLSFMGSKWDHGVPSKELWALVLRALRPGAPLLAFGGTRTAHRLVSAIEDAGFEIKDTLLYCFGSGFPKSHSIGKAIDKQAGAERSVIIGKSARHNSYSKGSGATIGHATGVPDIFAPATPEAAQWEGYGSALKPAYEPVCLAMKPLDGTYAHNALTHGVAGLNVDGARIGNDTSRGDHYKGRPPGGGHGVVGYAGEMREPWVVKPGRWPANLILDPESAAALDEQTVDRIHGAGAARAGATVGRPQQRNGPVPNAPVCNTANMFRFGDSGGASRFFYTAKTSTSERNAGLDGFEKKLGGGLESTVSGDTRGRPVVMNQNNHPCLKPLDLCRYLATLILPPNTGRPRRLLCPFSGSGSEMIGALLAGWDEVIGIEMNADYVAIAEARIRHWTSPGVWEAYAQKKTPKRPARAAEPPPAAASETRIKARPAAEERTLPLRFAAGT